MTTVLLSYCISNLIITLMIYLVWLQNKGQFKGVSHWLASFALQTTGIILVFLQDFTPNFISIVIAHMLIITGTLIFYFGLALFINKKINKAFYYTILGAIFLFYTAFQAELITRTTVLFLTLSFTYFQVAKILYNSTDIKMRHSYRLSANISIFIVIVYLLMAALYQLSPLVEEYINPSSAISLITISSQMLRLCLAFSIIIMLKNKLFITLEEESLKRERLLEEFKYQASTDGLTQLWNRKSIESKLHKEFDRSQRYRCKMSVILLDVDNFKNINDTYGHAKGDLVLKKIAELLQKTLRKNDIIGRWGGEEFKVICVETDQLAVWDVAEKLRKAISNYNWNLKTPVTISLGTATLKNNESIDDLLKRADVNMYKSKRAGRNATHPDLTQALKLAV
jgi:diguanylate cyclase (GGDEF)-like protein